MSCRAGRNWCAPSASRTSTSVRAVLDASAFVDTAIERLPRDKANAFGRGYDGGLVAPPLLWSEVTSALHRLAARGELDPAISRAHRALLEAAPIERRDPAGLRGRAWEIADRMGWGRTYDAEYCALAEFEGISLVTGDARLARGAKGRLPYVLRLDEEAARLA